MRSRADNNLGLEIDSNEMNGISSLVVPFDIIH